MPDTKEKKLNDNDQNKEEPEEVLGEASAENVEGSGNEVSEAASDDILKEQAESENSQENEKSGNSETDPVSQNDRGEKKGRKFFEKKKDKTDKKDEKIKELTDRLTRQMAEFDNFRKRTNKEKAANYIIGAKEVIEKLLPVVDNFERGLSGADLSDPFADGMNKVYKQLVSMLEELGVAPIESVGKSFDPNLHNAVMHIDDENYGENEIAEEFQKGYTFKDQVIRHSMVKVAN